MKKAHHANERFIRIPQDANFGWQSHEELCLQYSIRLQIFKIGKIKPAETMDLQHFA